MLSANPTLILQEQEDAEKEARGEISTKKRVANKRKEQQNLKKQKLEEKKNSLVAQYDSDSDSENDIMDLEKDAVSSKDPSTVGKILLPEDRPKRKCKYFLVDKCSKGDECEFSHEKPESKQKQKHPKAAPTFRKKPNLLFKVSFPFPCDQVYISKHYLAFGKRNTTRT